MSQPLHFFLGANTPQGFVSRFDQLADPADGWREFVIKGGPGTGKSTLMRKIAEEFEATAQHMELIHCSSDADSLDAVIIHDVKAAIADGTPPHAIEPKYPGAFEQLVDLSHCWNAGKLLESREPIMVLSAKISRCHEHCCRFLAAAGSLLGDTYRLALDAVSVQKVQKAARRLADAEFRGGGETRGKESVRFLSAVTNLGHVRFDETARTLCDRVCCVEDNHGAVSRLFLNVIRSAALEAGFDIISCYCPLSPFEKLEHIFIPALRLGFMTVNDYHQPVTEPYKVIRSRRFTDAETLSRARKRIAFNRKAAAQMLDQAARLLGEAKTFHDELERYYAAAMDFKKANRVAAETLEIFRGLA